MTKPAELRAVMLAAIGHELRRIHADIIAEGVPERLVELLRELDDPGNDTSLT